MSSVCSNRSSASGGTAIIFSRILNCVDISHNFHNFEHLEFSVVSFVRFSKSFCFAVVYLPQRSNKEITEFRLFVDQLKDFEFDFTIIVGDFNANHTSWGGEFNNSRGNQLYNNIIESFVSPVVLPKCTRVGNRCQRDSTIDLIF